MDHRTFISRLAIACLALALSAPVLADTAEPADTATVRITLIVQPYAEISLEARDMVVTFAGPGMGNRKRTIDFAGRVIANANVTLQASVTPPGTRSDETWAAFADADGNTSRTLEAGDNQLPVLLRIEVIRDHGVGGGVRRFRFISNEHEDDPTVRIERQGSNEEGEAVITVTHGED